MFCFVNEVPKHLHKDRLGEAVEQRDGLAALLAQLIGLIQDRRNPLLLIEGRVSYRYGPNDLGIEIGHRNALSVEKEPIRCLFSSQKVPDVVDVYVRADQSNPNTASAAKPPRFPLSYDGEPPDISPTAKYDIATTQRMLAKPIDVVLVDTSDFSDGHPSTHQVLRHDDRNTLRGIIRRVKLAAERPGLDGSTETIAH